MNAYIQLLEQFDSFDSDEDADDPIEDEHHVIFACSGYVYVRQLFQDLFGESTSNCLAGS